MAACGAPGEDARLFDAVKAASEFCIGLGISIPVGKDSLSMRTSWTDAGEKKTVTLTGVAHRFGCRSGDECDADAHP